MEKIIIIIGAPSYIPAHVPCLSVFNEFFSLRYNTRFVFVDAIISLLSLFVIRQTIGKVFGVKIPKTETFHCATRSLRSRDEILSSSERPNNYNTGRPVYNNYISPYPV